MLDTLILSVVCLKLLVFTFQLFIAIDIFRQTFFASVKLDLKFHATVSKGVLLLNTIV